MDPRYGTMEDLKNWLKKLKAEI
nr:hypothetical protein [Clostridium perfringens]